VNDDSVWMERAQSAEAKLSTLKQAVEPALQRVKDFKANFGVRERDNGEIDIDFEKLVENLGEAGALSLREVIDKRYSKTLHLKKVHG